jgi:beta-lactamase class A
VFAFGFGYNLGIKKLHPQLNDALKIIDEITNEENKMKKAEEDAKEKQKTAIKNLGDEFVKITKVKHPDSEWSILIKDLDTQNEFVYNNKQMNSASLIKLFMMEAVLKEVENGSFKLTDGDDGYMVNLEKMITESNNDSANMFIDAFDGYDGQKRKVTEEHTINKAIKSQGYEFTELNRKMHNTTPPGGPSGYQNYTSVKDVASLYEGLYNGTLLNEENTKLAIRFLKNQQRTNKIPKLINKNYPDVVVANKTGELSNVENDAAIIYGDNYNVIFVVMSESESNDLTEKGKIQQTISELSNKLVEFYQNK